MQLLYSDVEVQYAWKLVDEKAFSPSGTLFRGPIAHSVCVAASSSTLLPGANGLYEEINFSV